MHLLWGRAHQHAVSQSPDPKKTVHATIPKGIVPYMVGHEREMGMRENAT